MCSFRKILSLSFLFLYLSLSFVSSAFSFGEYTDHQGSHISFRFLPEASSGEEEKKLFVASFDDNYRGLAPSQIKPHFTTREEVTEWLTGVFVSEWSDFKKAQHPMRVIDILKDGRLVGFAIVERWGKEATTLHIRQMAVALDEQKHGYGSTLIEVLKTLPEMGPADRIIADTRTLNVKAQAFYKKLNFSMTPPHDPELAGNGNYIGLEWRSSPKLQ